MRFHWLYAALVALVLSVPAALAAEQLNGRYIGVEDAEGASIEIEPDPGGYTGTFYDRQGNSQGFMADAIGDGAAAVLDMDGRTILMRITPLPNGAQVTLAPVDKKGTVQSDLLTILLFLREGAKLPKVPQGFAAAPASNCNRVAAYSFMVSYELWDPSGVVNGYRCLPERTKTMLNFFPAVRLDVIRMICEAPNNNAELAKALRRTSLSCNAVNKGVAGMKSRGRYDAFRAEVKKERDSLIMSIRCAEGYPETRANCRAAARRLQDNAVSLRTPAQVMDTYQ